MWVSSLVDMDMLMPTGRPALVTKLAVLVAVLALALWSRLRRREPEAESSNDDSIMAMEEGQTIAEVERQTPPPWSMPADLAAPPGLSLQQEEWPMPSDLWLSLPQEESPMSADLSAPPGLPMPADLGAPPGLSGRTTRIVTATGKASLDILHTVFVRKASKFENQSLLP
eukprot:s4367_g2.t3